MRASGRQHRATSEVQERSMTARTTDQTAGSNVRKTARRKAAQGKAAATLPETMTGRVSPAKAAVCDKP
jgi:hypothetical protein